MQADRFTVKSQEAVAAAQQLAGERRNPEATPAHLLVALLGQDDGLVVPILQKLGSDPAAIAARAEEAVGALPTLSEGGEARMSSSLAQTLRGAEKEMAKLGDEYISTEHILLALTDPASGVADLLPDRASLEKAIAEVRGPHRVTSPNPEDTRAGAGEIRPRPDRRRGQRQARPGDRPRRGDPSRGPGALAADEEQPGPDRRPRGRQDRDRRGPGAADRRRRRAREPARPARDRARHRLPARRLEISRRVRGAAESGAERGAGGRGPDRPLPRRAAHDRRRRRRRRGGRRGQPAEADAGARRAARGRRDHARRVPQAHREGRGAGAPLPAGAGRRARHRRHDRDPARAEGALRGPSRRAHRRLGDRRRRDPLRALHRRPLPARQGDRPDRRGGFAAEDRDRLDADRDRRGRAPHPAAGDRARGAEEGERRGLQGAPGGARVRAGRAARALGRDEGALAEREGGDRLDQGDQGAAGGGRARGRAGRARGRPRARGEAALRRDPGAGEGGRRAGRAAGRAARLRRLDADRGGDRGGRRRGRRQMDRDPGQPPDGGRGREADQDGGAPARAGGRAGRGDRRRLQRAAALTRRALGPPPTDRVLPLPRPDRGRQDRAGEGAGRVHVRLRAGDRPARHVRVHGETHGGAADRRAARLRRLRGGRAADRGGAPPALRGRPARRDREGPPRRLQHPAAADGRRPPHRRPGPHRQLHQHRPDHDLQRRQRPDRRRGGRRAHARADRRGAGGDLQAGVPQPDRRHRDLPPPLQAGHRPDRRPPGGPAGRPGARAGDRDRAQRRRPHPARQPRLRPDLRRAAAEARGAEAADRQAGAEDPRGRVRRGGPRAGRRGRGRARLRACRRAARRPPRRRPRAFQHSYM